MPIMDTVVGGVGSGIQPKDNPNPFASGPSAAAQTAMNSLPEPARAPAQAAAPGQAPPQAAQPGQPAPQDANQAPASQPSSVENEAKDVDALFSKLQSPKEKASGEQSEVDDLFKRVGVSDVDDKAPIVDARKPGEGYFQYKMKSLPQELQFIGAQMRAHLGTDPKQQKQAFQSMYGDDNVKNVGKDLYFRPNPDDKFRKVDQTLYNGMVDWTLFNALKAIPMGANVAAQGGTDAAAILGSPESGGASLAGLAAGGAVGGAAESATRQTMQQVMNAFSSKPQDITDDTLSSMALNAGGALLAKPVVLGARSAVSKFGEILGSAFPAATEVAEKAAGSVTTKLAMARNAFKQFVGELYPHASTFEDSGEFASNMQGVFQKADDRLTSTVSAIRNEVVSIADQQAKKVPMDNSVKKLKDTLQGYGYAANTDGSMELADQGQLTLAKPDVRNALESLKNHYNYLTGQSEIQGGLDAKDMFSKVDQLGKLAKFDKGAPVADDALKLYRDAWNGSVQDRNSFIDQMYKNSGSKYQDTWNSEFAKFKDQIDSVRDLKGMLRDDGSRENFLNSLMTGSKVDKTNLIEATRNILGPDSKEWNGLQGQMINHLIETNSKDGVVNGAKLAEYIRNPNNSSMVDRLFTPEDKTLFQKMALETAQIDRTGKMSDGQREVIKSAVGKMFGAAIDAKQAVFNVMKGLGSSQVQVNYLMDKGFNDMIDKAEGPEIRSRLMEGRRLMEGLTSKMKIIDMPSTLERATQKTVRRYAPAIGAGAADYAESKLPVPQDSGSSSTPGTP